MSFQVKTRSRKRQIAINGSLGSGKTTVGRQLSQDKGWEYHSTGAVQRNIAQAMGINTLELNHIAESDRSIDERIDTIFKSLSSKENIVVDSRMAWHFLPDSFRVRLVVSPEEAADRVLRDTARDAEKYSSSLVATRDIEARTQSERKRFLNTYNVDITDLSNYDLVVDTEFLAPDTVANLISSAFFFWLNLIHFPQSLISPKIAIPSKPMGNLDTDVVAGLTEQFHGRGVDVSPKVLHYRGRYIITEDHELFCAAIRAGVTAMPVKIVTDIRNLGIANKTAEAFIKETVSLKKISEWEDACGIKYANHPAWLS